MRDLGAFGSALEANPTLSARIDGVSLPEPYFNASWALGAAEAALEKSRKRPRKLCESSTTSSRT